MKKSLFALILGLAAAPSAWACSLNDMNCQGWYHNEYLPQQQQRAQQQTTRSSSYYESRYGAIAQSYETGRVFGNNNRRSQEEANRDILNLCQRSEPGTTCQLLQTYSNGCLAIAIDSNRKGHYGMHERSKWTAKRKAMQECKASGSGGCQHFAIECSLPVLVRY